MKKLIIIALTAWISTFCTSCRMLSQKNKEPEKHISAIAAGTTQLAQMYNPSSTTIHPKVFVKKNDTTDIDLFVIINDSELLFSKANAQNQQLAKVKVFYKIMESFESGTMIDTSMRIVSIAKTATPKTFAIKLKLKHVDLPKFVVQTTITDLVRGKMNISFNTVDKYDSTGIDNFNVTYTTDGQPFQKNYADLGTQLTIKYNNTPGLHLIYNTVLPVDSTIPKSPYATLAFYNDSTIHVDTEAKPLQYSFTIDKPGIYFTTADSVNQKGFAIPCFGNDHPNVTTPDDMLKTIKYLCTDEEYATIKEKPSKKLAVDDFWYSCTKDIKKSKELIRVYYTRAVFANIFFTDHRQGMLTDRGMVYIVMGPPQMMAITSKAEIWTYHDRKEDRKIKFVFRKRQTTLTTPEYRLYRSTEFKPYWDFAVDTWRKGNIYTF
ncbi:MAG: GWxTD domain-containing protein [Bacteroidales bacterium]|nr:GWxTD domain-containing protein [Bacteroidales bacterium]